MSGTFGKTVMNSNLPDLAVALVGLAAAAGGMMYVHNYRIRRYLESNGEWVGEVIR